MVARCDFGIGEERSEEIVVLVRVVGISLRLCLGISRGAMQIHKREVKLYTRYEDIYNQSK
jgi:hypothetical protein